jgi:hypothetical protein
MLPRTSRRGSHESAPVCYRRVIYFDLTLLPIDCPSLGDPPPALLGTDDGARRAGLDVFDEGARD